MESSVVIGEGACTIVADADVAWSETEMTAVSEVVNEPAERAKDTDVEPAGTVTDGGAVRFAVLMAIETTSPCAVAGWESVTEQAVLALGERVLSAHLRALTVSGATSEITSD